MLLLCSVVVTLQATSYEYFIAVCGFNTLFDHHFIPVELSWDECSFAVPNGTLNLCNGVVNLSANIICNCILITTDCMTLSHHLSLSNCWNHKSAPLQLYTSQSNQPKPRFLNVPHSHVLAGLAYHVDQSKYRVDQKKCDLKKNGHNSSEIHQKGKKLLCVSENSALMLQDRHQTVQN